MGEPLNISQDHWRSRWLVFPDWHVLHRVSRIKWHGEPDEMIEGNGATVCGRRGFMRMPGIVSRTGLRRCRKCSAALGIPQGRGAPYNEDIREPGDEKPRKFLRRKKWQEKQPFKLRRASFKGQGLQPDQRSASWESLRELAYGDRSG